MISIREEQQALICFRILDKLELHEAATCV